MAFRISTPLRRPKRIWEDNIKIDVQEVGWKSMSWIDLAQDRDRRRAIVNPGNVLASWESIILSRSKHASKAFNIVRCRRWLPIPEKPVEDAGRHLLSSATTRNHLQGLTHTASKPWIPQSTCIYKQTPTQRRCLFAAICDVTSRWLHRKYCTTGNLCSKTFGPGAISRPDCTQTVGYREAIACFTFFF
jgi:hypothetical protein